MRDIAVKTDGSSSLDSGDFNSLQAELENICTSADFTLDTLTDSDLFMLSKSFSAYSNAGAVYQDSGSANAHILSLSSNLKLLAGYVDGMKVIFKAAAANTGPATITLGSLAEKDIIFSNDDPLESGAIIANKYNTIFYNLSLDKFILLFIADDKKQYSVSGGDFTLTNVGPGGAFTSTSGDALPYLASDGKWRLTFRLKVELASNQTAFSIQMSGVEFVLSEAIHPFGKQSASPSTLIGFKDNITGPFNSTELLLEVSSASADTIEISGDVPLQSKPTWAD